MARPTKQCILILIAILAVAALTYDQRFSEKGQQAQTCLHANIPTRDVLSVCDDLMKTYAITDRTRARALFRQAYAHQLSEDYPNAAAKYEDVLALRPKWSWPLQNVTTAYLKMEQYDKALQTLDRALDRKPRATKLRLRRAYVHFEAGSYPQALSDVDDVLNTSPLMKGAHRLRHRVLRKLARYDEALLAVSELIEFEPDYVTASLDRAGLYLYDFDKPYHALVDTADAIARDPEYDFALNRHAAALRQTKRDAEALEVLQRALALDPDNAYARKYSDRLKGDIAVHQKHANLLLDVLTVNPANINAALKRADLLRTLNEYAKATAMLEQLWLSYPDNGRIFRKLIDLYGEQRDHTAVLRVMSQNIPPQIGLKELLESGFGRSMDPLDLGDGENELGATRFDALGFALKSVGDGEAAHLAWMIAINTGGEAQLELWQLRLQVAGYYDGPPDGVSSKAFEAALKAYALKVSA